MYDTKAIKQFDILPEQHLKRSLPTTVDGVCDRIASKSYISMQPAETQKQIMDHVRQIFAAESDENLQRKWIDKAAGTFEYPYATGEYATNFVDLCRLALTRAVALHPAVQMCFCSKRSRVNHILACL